MANFYFPEEFLFIAIKRFLLHLKKSKTYFQS